MIHRFVIRDPETWDVIYQGLRTSAREGFPVKGDLKLESAQEGAALFELVFYVDDTEFSPAQFAMIQRSLA